MKQLKAIGAMSIALCVIFVVLIPTAVSYQDLEYMEWSTEKSEMSHFYNNKIIEALSEEDWSSLKSYSDLWYDFYSDVLDEIDQFDVSPGYLSKAKDEHKASYEDMKWVAYYFNKIADAYLSGEGYNDYYFQRVKLHLESAMLHNEKEMEYQEKYSIVNVAVTYYVNPGDSIQSAINAASSGDIIIVRDGNYTENINVNKLLMMVRSENGSENCIIQAANSSDHAITISADFVIISGFNVTGVSGKFKAGIYGYNVEHCIIFDNNAFDNCIGIYLHSYSSNNVITNNIITSNNPHGLITGGRGIYIDQYCSSNAITNNIINSAGSILLHGHCSDNLVSGNKISNSDGIGLFFRWDSRNNIITKNNLSSNVDAVLFTDGASNNILYLNNFINTGQNGFTGYTPLTNIWKSPEMVSYTYNNKTFINYLGNYWEDYTGSDGNGDGISDTSYNMPEGNSDEYSLIVPFENYKIEYPPLAILASTKASCDQYKTGINRDEYGYKELLEIQKIIDTFNNSFFEL